MLTNLVGGKPKGESSRIQADRLHKNPETIQINMQLIDFYLSWLTGAVACNISQPMTA